MPLIPIPTSEPDEEPVSTPVIEVKSKEWYLNYLNVPDWKCPECGAVMFGRVKFCVYCKFRLRKNTPRPSDYVEQN